VLTAVSVSDKEAAFMREAYATWLDALGKSDKYKNSKPDWVWIDDVKEAEKVRVAQRGMAGPDPSPPFHARRAA